MAISQAYYRKLQLVYQVAQDIQLIKIHIELARTSLSLNQNYISPQIIVEQDS